MKSQLLALLVILTAALQAQVDERPPKKGGAEAEEVQSVTSGDSEIEILPDGSRIIRTTNADGEMIEKHIPAEDSAGVPHLPPEEMAAHGGGFFDASVMVRPRRLAPGETGELYIHVTLRGIAVVVPGARVEVKYEKAQGPLSLGQHEVKPAQRGMRKTRFKGQPVWDDALTFKIPVSVRADAKFGQAKFEGSVLLEVTDGRSGELLGRFRAVAPGQVQIGRPFPRPMPEVGRQGAKEATGKQAAGGDPTAAGTRPGGDAGTQQPKRSGDSGAKAGGGGRLVGEGQVPDPAVGDGQPPPEGLEDEIGDDGLGLPDAAFWGVGGLLLLVLVLLVMRRR